jgi:hypothetical protein
MSKIKKWFTAVVVTFGLIDLVTILGGEAKKCKKN